MIKIIHFIFILTSLASFIVRIALSVIKPDIIQKKIVKITPHIIDTILLISGIALIIQGNWLDGEFGWIVSKLILLLVYIALGVMAMRFRDYKRWLAFTGAISCYIFIFIIAITKKGFI